ncbi:MAG: HEAT repeat domain-containing protein [Elusimicrobiales bacterium]
MKWLILTVVFIAGSLFLAVKHRLVSKKSLPPAVASVIDTATAATDAIKQEVLPERDPNRATNLTVSAEARQRLYRLVDDPSDKVRWSSVELLYRIGDTNIEPVVKHRLSKETEVWVKRNIVAMLATNKDRENMRLLAVALSDYEDDVRLEAVNSLASYNCMEVVPALEKAIGDTNNDVKLRAIEAIRDINARLEQHKRALEEEMAAKAAAAAASKAAAATRPPAP